MSKTKAYFGVVICAFLASLFVSGLYNNIVFAASASISTTGTVSIDVSAAGNSANLGSDTLTVNTTCSTGYTVSISGSIADTTLYKDGDNTSTSKITPSTGTVTSPASILGNNLGTWGYSTTATSVQDNFIGLTNTPTIIKQSTTASGDGSGSATTGNDTIPVYYGVSIPTSLEPGTYTMAKDSSNNPGTIVYQLTMPTECDPYVIKYNGNNNDTGTTMSVTNAVDEGQSTTLMPSNYKRAGYGFAGWSTVQLNPDSSNFNAELESAVNNNKVYGPMETITIDSNFISLANNDKEITLYAIWVKSAGNIQSWQGCDSLAQGTVTALTDTRDNNVYAVAKLADGNCWMIENLRLGGSSAMNLTTSNTVTAFTLPASTNTFTTSNSTTIEMSAKNTLEASADMTATNAEVYSYGNYYSWPAAIGSTTAYSTNNQSVSTSICPSGWHLPKGGDKSNESNNEFWKLIVTGLNNNTNPANYSSSTYPYYTGDPEGTNVSKLVRKYPNNFIYSGYLGGSSFSSRGSVGYYWSSTVSSSDYSYRLNFGSSSVYPGTGYYYKYNGFSVRCVADTTYTIRYNGNQTGQTTYNTAQTVSGSMSNTTATYNAVHTLRANGFSRLGFRFLGWSTNAAATTATYTNSQALTAAQVNSLVGSNASGATINLYAIWQPKSSLNSITSMQQMTAAICNDTYTPTSATTTANTNQYFSANNIPQRTLTDTRDNNTYTVRKLADGKCWMTQNLRLVGSRTLTSANSNVSSNFTLPASSTNWVTANDGVARINNSGNTSYGVYYNWYAATAGTGTAAMTSGNATSSVCPKGWRLPTGGTGTGGDFRTLYMAYRGNDAGFISNTSAVLSGVWNGSSASTGSSGNWWSSTASGSSNGYILNFTSSIVYPFNGEYKRTGCSVRCVSQ